MRLGETIRLSRRHLFLYSHCAARVIGAGPYRQHPPVGSLSGDGLECLSEVMADVFL